MGITGLHHLVVRVPDVPDAQAFYTDLFDLAVLFREGVRDGDVGTVPADRPWKEAIDAGVTPTMAFLDRDGFTLAVASPEGEPARRSPEGAGTVDHVALAVDGDALEGITRRAEDLGCDVERNASHHRVLTDRYGFEWELNAKPRPPSQAFPQLDICS